MIYQSNIFSWNVNIATSAGACKWLGLAPNSNIENNALKAAIKKAGSDSGLDPRFILAAVFHGWYPDAESLS